MNKTDAAETDRAAITKTTAELLVLKPVLAQTRSRVENSVPRRTKAAQQ
jgi:hypothetical protein